MDMIIDYWPFLIAVVCMIICIAESLIVFYAEPTDKKLACLREWLMFAVIEAEKAYKSGTGAIKLRYVYDLAITKFKWIPRLLTFDMFSKMVDDALEWMRVQLESNKNVKDYVDGK